jgi:hypothetical protein
VDRRERLVTKRNISILLDQLGSTPETVARSLQRAGVHGDPFLGAHCPIARYLHAVVGVEPGIGKVKIGLCRATVNAPHWWWPISVALPLPVRLFVLAFDRGQFPELLWPETAASASPPLLPLAGPRPLRPHGQGPSRGRPGRNPHVAG